ncbi:MAG: TetR/AcrR family transcriptional regulator [Coriobacteriales bacterium]|jgi:AcrR family transcriptional regulator|nr:TetR/AcrR family transcriptional regulator [Coriobacteriales bacterium]
MTSNEGNDRRLQKEEAILEGARTVFCQKGYLEVTMKDIIDECGISRGGIYLYFDSVDEVFMAAAKRRMKRKYEDILAAAETDMPFFELFDAYTANEKARLLNMETSMLRSIYEYFFTHDAPEDRAFRQSQLSYVRDTINEILQLGARQGVLQGDNLDLLAESFMLITEGLSVLVLMGGASEAQVDRQFALMRSLLPVSKEAAVEHNAE